MDWTTDNIETIFKILSLVWLAINLLVGLTPTNKDDAVVGKIALWLERLSFFKRPDHEGTFKMLGMKSKDSK